MKLCDSSIIAHVYVLWWRSKASNHRYRGTVQNKLVAERGEIMFGDIFVGYNHQSIDEWFETSPLSKPPLVNIDSPPFPWDGQIQCQSSIVMFNLFYRRNPMSPKLTSTISLSNSSDSLEGTQQLFQNHA
jgi:hypothetical protein